MQQPNETGPGQAAPDVATASLRRRLRLGFLAFLLTFAASRLLVFLIMARRLPDLYLHVGGTHVHHLNHGIFLLAGVGAWLLFGRVAGRALSVATVLYAVGLALTFDEFGMWLHLGGGYWQRASFDAVVVVAALFGLAAYAPPLRAWRPRHVGAAVAAAVAALLFFAMLAESFRFGARMEQRFSPLEQHGPS